MPRRCLVAAGLTLLLAAAPPAAACELPGDETSAPLRRMVARVKYLPETEIWAELMSRTRTVVHYILLLDEPRRVDGRCHWPIEIRAEDRLWKRFLVPGEGGKAIEVIEQPAAPAQN
jgi:hypothetical protein